MNNRVCIVIPAMNEEKTITEIVCSAKEQGYMVIVVDDASTDETVNNAKNSGAKVLKNIKNIGAWKATQAGLRYAKKLGYQTVITMDADGQHKVEDIPKLIACQKEGADIVIGNCTSRGSAGRHIAWFAFRFLNRLTVGDITSGFRLYNEKALQCLTSRQATMFEYQCVGVLLMMRNVDLVIKEVSVNMDARITGASRIFHSWKAVGYYILYSAILTTTKAFPTRKDRYIKRLQD